MATEPQSIGLPNLGNTCYMGAVLQALFSYNEFRDLIITYNTDKTLPIHHSLGVLFDRMVTKSANVRQALIDFKYKFLAFGNNKKDFEEWTEQDSQEFYIKLMESLNLESNGISHEQYILMRHNIPSNVSYVQQVWNLYLEPYKKQKHYMEHYCSLFSNTNKCSFGHQYNQYDEHWVHMICFTEDTNDVYLLSTQSCIDDTQKWGEVIGGKCPFNDDYKCKGKLSVQRLCVISPKLLVIHMFLFNTPLPKSIKNVIVNQCIVVNNTNYELLAFIVHRGNSPQHGHYITIRRYNNKWVMYNDSSPVQHLTIKEELCDKLKDAYMLYYRECDQVIDKYTDFEYNQIEYLQENPSIYYSTLFVENEQQLPLWTERQTTDSDFDLKNSEILNITLQNQNISVNDYIKSNVESTTVPRQRYYVYIGTDPITKIILLCDIIHKIPAKPMLSDKPSQQSPKPTESSNETRKSHDLGEERDFRVNTSGHRFTYCVATKACVIRKLTKDANRREMYQLMLCLTEHNKYKEYCVTEEEDSDPWYLFIENFMYAENREYLRKMFEEQDEDGSYLTCTEETHFELTRFDRKTRQISGCVPINTVIPHSSNGVLKLAIQVKPFGQNGHRNMWYSTDREPDSGIVELDSSLEYEKQLLSQTRNNTYFGIFVYNNAKLVMRDYFEFSGKTLHCTLFLDATFIMFERQLSFTFSPEEYTKTYDFKDLKNVKALKSEMASTILKHPILFVRDLPSQHKSKVWEFTVESQKSKIGGTQRKGFLYLPSDDAIKFIDYLDWADGHKYIRYYQKMRDWSTTIVMENNTAGVYQTEKQTAGEPKSIWSGHEPDTWDRSKIS